MTRSELIKAMAQAISGAPFPTPTSRWKATVALSALTSTIPGGEAALMALVNGEAVAVPMEATREMQIAATARPQPDPDDAMYGGIYRAMLAATPYAAKEGRDG